ncbi:hypothetical protein M407DRAFT_32526 [Tulasnella calospora MUT 4182]|uniref:Protein kinase domain-containing protein n=1 Tax=Tulasnella calospora MUT 4182 TaxID=1051891 RepID=A0A0C3Q4K8_9AGAM|nr:hypothetical protein M407DRAFT_32526 [Tulasnella calospora MUT 4182]
MIACEGDFDVPAALEHIASTQELNADPSTRLAASASTTFPKNNEPLQFTVTASETALTLTGPACSLRWAPPEVLNGETLGLAGDIWALGWIAWEALTDDYPFEELKLDFEVTMRIIEGHLPSIYDHDQLSQIRSLCSPMQSCWKPEPKERPSAIECLKTLRWIENRGKHRLQNRHEEASKMYEEGLSIARSTGDQNMVAELLVLLVENQPGQFGLVGAEASLTEALTIFKRVGNDGGQANALREIGEVQRSQGRHVEAEPWFTEALAIYKRIGRDLGQANTLRGLGDVQRSLSKNFEAETSFNPALAIYESLGHKLGRANALSGLGNVCLARSEYTEAEAGYTQALAIYESIGNDLGRVTAALDLSRIRFRQARYAEAKALINETEGISKRLDYSWGMRTSEIILRRILEAESRRSVELGSSL